MDNSRGRGGSFSRGRGGFRGASRGAGRGDYRGGRGAGSSGRGGRPAPYAARDTKPINPTKLHVSNIPEGVTSKQLERLFEECGKVLECDIIRDFAFVHFKSPEEASAAVEQFHGYELNGTAINVRHSTSTLRQKPGTAKGDCFRCGGRGHSSLECPTELRERGLLPPRSAASYAGYDSYDPYALPLPRDPYLDPYERLERDPYYRRRLAALAAADPFLRESLRSPYAPPRSFDTGDDLGDQDPYDRPPPEFYQRRGRGGRAASQSAAAGNSYRAEAASSGRPANDPYFYNDDYDKTPQAGYLKRADVSP